jgi:hypothetical protein
MSEPAVDRDEAPAGRVRGDSSQHRHWCFTLNNYTIGELDGLRTLVSDGNGNGVVYLCFQPEVGANGTQHLQGFISFKNARRLGGVKRLISSRCHLEPMRGTAQQAREYCRKADTFDPAPGFAFAEWGTFPGGAGHPGARTDLSDVVSLVKEGKRARDIFESHGEQFVRYYKGIERCIALLEPVRAWKTEVFWYYGPTGTGKSRAVLEEAPDAYWKDSASQWWDGYEGHEDVVIDDYRTNFCQFNFLLRLLDRYPMTIQIKGGTRNFLGRRVFITTPHCVEDTWSTRTEEQLGQLLRRVEHQKEFTLEDAHNN